MISVLIPSRGRPEGLKNAIFSLINTSCDYHNLEFVVRIDDDDPQKDIYHHLDYKVIPAFINMWLYEGPRGNGYKDLHLMVNDLAAKSKGEWLMLWNDDAVMKTKNWDMSVNLYDSEYPFVLNLNGDGMNLFPVVSRTFYAVQGHFSLNPHNDSWVTDVAHFSNCHFRIHGIEIEHLRDQINDATKAESQGAYAQTSPEFYGPENQKLLMEDVQKIKDWYEKSGAQKPNE